MELHSFLVVKQSLIFIVKYHYLPTIIFIQYRTGVPNLLSSIKLNINVAVTIAVTYKFVFGSWKPYTAGLSKSQLVWYTLSIFYLDSQQVWLRLERNQYPSRLSLLYFYSYSAFSMLLSPTLSHYSDSQVAVNNACNSYMDS